MSVSGNRTKSVDKDETNAITQKRETTVDGLEKDTFNASREVRITGTDLHDVSDMLTEQIGGGRRTTIDQGDHRTVASGDSKTTVSGGMYLVTSSDKIKLTQGDTHYLRLDGLAKLGTTGVVTVTNDATTVEGDEGGTLTLNANTEIKLQCGAGSISIKSDGTIEVTGTTIELKSGGSGVKVEASGVTANGGTVTVGGGSMVNVSASVVKIN
jgi:type VI secretion system secreted protein VgrG